MKHGVLKQIALGAILLVGLGVSTSAKAQFTAGNPRMVVLTAETNVGSSTVLRDGDEVTYNDKTYIVGRDFIAVERGSEIKVNGVPVKVQPRFVLSAANYPFASFSVSGSLIRPSDGALTGGTKSIMGQVTALDGAFSIGERKSLEIGGFYFKEYDKPTDLYMATVRYFPTPEFGFQVGYIDSTQQSAKSLSYMMIYRISSSLLGARGRLFQVELGLGALNNLTQDFHIGSTRYVNRASVNFTSFVEVSYEFSKNWRLLGSQWFIRDRTNDVSRFGIGVGYKF